MEEWPHYITSFKFQNDVIPGRSWERLKRAFIDAQ
jgi:hypothetical protein